jgi:2-oxoglutarate ferredoxin oxidoreductase subunit alpha
MTPYGGAHLLRVTTSTHDERGFLTKKADDVDRLNRRLSAKIDDHADELSMVDADLQPGADTLVVSYGITAVSARDAVAALRRDGRAVSHVAVQSLWPVPEAALAAAMEGVSRVVVPELNLGQYAREVERLAEGRVAVLGVHRVDGHLIAPEEIVREVAA